MSEFTPTTEQVKSYYRGWLSDVHGIDVGEDQFDRWLTQRDAEVAEETLNTAIMLLKSELEETEPHPEEARGLTRALQILSLLATRQGPRDET